MGYSYNCGIAGYQDCACAHAQISNFLRGLGAPKLIMYIDDTLDQPETRQVTQLLATFSIWLSGAGALQVRILELWVYPDSSCHVCQ